MNALGQVARQLALLEERTTAGGDWRVRPSERARRLAVRVLPGGTVEIVVPRGTRPRAVEQFVTRHRRWIERTVDLYRPLAEAVHEGMPAEIHFAASRLRYAVIRAPARGVPRLALDGATIRLCGDAQPARLRHLLRRFVLREARAVLGAWLAGLSAATGLGYARLQVRRQRTRWGSCSRTGTISLNACLMFQPPAVVNYLLLHELAHTRHMNHSRRFWTLVERLEPGWRELDQSLTGGWRRVPAWFLD